MANKKSFNPFKMWGSYVGALVFFFLPIIQQFGFSDVSIMNSAFTLSLKLFDIPPELNVGIVFALWIGTTILVLSLGFLIGWGIHSIFRAIRN